MWNGYNLNKYGSTSMSIFKHKANHFIAVKYSLKYIYTLIKSEYYLWNDIEKLYIDHELMCKYGAHAYWTSS